jgi:hypothetical protein
VVILEKVASLHRRPEMGKDQNHGLLEGWSLREKRYQRQKLEAAQRYTFDWVLYFE